MNKKQFDKGYDDCIAAIKERLANGGKNSQQQGGSNDLPMPEIPGQDSAGSGDPGDQKGDDQRKADGTINGSDNVGQYKAHGNRGNSSEMVDGIPGSDAPQGAGPGQDGGGTGDGPAGGMMDRQDGDKTAQREGYDKGPDSGSLEKELQEITIKKASKLRGKGAGDCYKRLAALFRTTTDWRKDLRKIVGRCINSADKRQAFANKNVLVSQDRIARTDKDKYDVVDYIIAAIDSSGSISDKQLQVMLGEVYSVALQKKPLKLDLVYCDAAVSEILEFDNLSDFKKYAIHAKVIGRGGTEFQPLWDIFKQGAKSPLRDDKSKKIAAKWQRGSTDLMMLFTDGYCTQYKRDPIHMRNLCWVFVDNPTCSLNYKEPNTLKLHINSADVKD